MGTTNAGSLAYCLVRDNWPYCFTRPWFHAIAELLQGTAGSSPELGQRRERVVPLAASEELVLAGESLSLLGPAHFPANKFQ